MSTEIDALPRIKLNAAHPKNQQLAEDVAELLGYRQLLRYNDSTKLMFVLEELEIQPYDNVAVKDYMKKMVEQNNGEGVVRRKQTPRQRSEEENLHRLYSQFRDTGMNHTDTMQRIQSVAYGMSSMGTTDIWYWEKTEIGKYKHPIPTSALQLAVDIKKRMGDTPHRFQVHSLMKAKVVNDPFLSVEAADHHHYFIAVWDEPTFNG